MKKWQVKIKIKHNYPFTSDTYTETIAEYYNTEEKAHKRFMEVVLNNYMFDGEVEEITMKEIKLIRKVEF